MKIHRDKFKTFKNVFDLFTEKNLSKLITKGYFDGLESPISIGKEANIFTALKQDGTRVVVKKVKSKPARKKYVGSTDTKIFHLTSARMSKMIKPKNRVYNNTKKYFTKLGFKPSKELLEHEKKERAKKRKR